MRNLNVHIVYCGGMAVSAWSTYCYLDGDPIKASKEIALLLLTLVRTLITWVSSLLLLPGVFAWWTPIFTVVLLLVAFSTGKPLL